jgi:hypothetical protein
VAESGATGVIITQGGLVGGWSLYAYEGRLKYCYNFLGIDHLMVTVREPIPAGKHQVRMEFKYDGGGLGKGRRRHPLLRRPSRGPGPRRTDAADDLLRRRSLRRRRRHRLTRITGLRPNRHKFSGQIDWVQIDIGDDSQDHLIKAEDRLTIAMERQ